MVKVRGSSHTGSRRPRTGLATPAWCDSTGRNIWRVCASDDPSHRRPRGAETNSPRAWYYVPLTDASTSSIRCAVFGFFWSLALPRCSAVRKGPERRLPFRHDGFRSHIYRPQGGVRRRHGFTDSALLALRYHRRDPTWPGTADTCSEVFVENTQRTALEAECHGPFSTSGCWTRCSGRAPHLFLYRANSRCHFLE